MAGTGRLSVPIYFGLLIALVSSQDSNTTLPPTTTTTAIPTDVTPTDIPENTDLGPCTCDLTKDGCDVNCCCDGDCSTEDKEAFSYCADEYLQPDNKMCVQERIMFDSENNGRYPYTTEVTDSGLFCVYKSNYDESNYYNIPDTITTDTKFEEYSETYGGFSYQPEPVTSSIQTTHYRSGDPIYTIYESEVLGLLGLAAPLTSGGCKDTNPAAFLYSQYYECIRYIENLEAACENSTANAPFNALTYYSNFKVISTPEELFQEFDNETNVDPSQTPLYNISLEVQPVGPHTCIGEDGLNITCEFDDLAPPPPELGTGVCKNVVVKVEYTLEHNSTDGLTSVGVTFTLRDVNLEDSGLSLAGDEGLSVTQAFSTNFKKLGETIAVQKSGSPGYKVGEPLLAGKMVERQLDETTEDLTYAIEISDNRNNWLTMVRSTATGVCTNETSNRVSVVFGEDMRSGCLIKLSLDDLTDNTDGQGSNICDLVNDAALNALRGADPPTHVARFGDTSPETTGDWVEILDDRDNLQNPLPNTGAPGCTNIVLGLHMEVVYANVGALGNPQPKVIGVKFHYRTGPITYQCIGPYCMEGMGGAVQSFEVVSSVGFIDASDPVIGVDAEKPSVSARLPEDFFAPFS